MKFGEKLKQIRAQRELSQEDLADILGTSKQVISRYEKGQRTPKITTAQEYAKKLELPLDYLIDDSQDTPKKKPTTVFDDGLNPEHVELLKSLSKADLDIVLSVARQMKQREIELDK